MTASLSQRETIGIVAASGEMPVTVAEKLTAQGKDVFIIALKDIATADLSSFNHMILHIGQLGKIISAFLDANCHQIVLVGKLTRPSFFAIKPDLRGAKIFTKVMSSSDDKALKILQNEFAKDGITFLDIGKVMPKIYADEGVLTGQTPNDEVQASINLGIDILKATGKFDMGQGCVVQAERILALEGAEGTDGMLQRLSHLIVEGGADPVFVKMLKATQDPSLDPPGFGVDTVRNAAAAGVKVIALQANAVVMIDKKAALAEAEKSGLTIIGFTLD